MGKRILSYIWAVLFVLSMTMYATGITANAASSNAVKTLTVRADKEDVTKKTYELEKGKSKSLKVTAAPEQAVKSIRYKSNKPKIVAVSKKGKVTAKKKGTAKIQITVTGKNNKKKTTWVEIKVTESKQNPTPDPVPENKRILVAYFSATNTTERLAEFIADGLSADLYEIVPEIPYTSADLNYGNSSSRTSIEMNDINARPAISGSVEDMGQYDTVFLGYPIWLAYHNLIQCTQA